MRAATGFEPSDKWFGQQAVYRISMGNFLFFGSMSLALLGVKYKGDKRGQVLQQGNWMIKLVVWVLFMVLPFLFPNGVVQVYGEHMAGWKAGFNATTGNESWKLAKKALPLQHLQLDAAKSQRCTFGGGKQCADRSRGAASSVSSVASKPLACTAWQAVQVTCGDEQLGQHFWLLDCRKHELGAAAVSEQTY